MFSSQKTVLLLGLASLGACAQATPSFVVENWAVVHAPCEKEGALARETQGETLLVCSKADQGFPWQKTQWAEDAVGLIWKRVGSEAWIDQTAESHQTCAEAGALALDETGAVMVCADGVGSGTE